MRHRDPGDLPCAVSAASVLAGMICAAGMLVSGCGDDADGGTADSGSQLQVGTTVAPITSIAANIGGDRVKITGIVPEGTNSHTFEPKPSVAELLSQLDVLFVNGLKLEEPTKELAEENLKDGRGDRRARHEVDSREPVRV